MDIMGLEVTDMRGFNAVFPPEANCGIVNTCISRLKNRPELVEMPDFKKDPRFTDLMKKVGKVGVSLLFEEFLIGARCQAMNEERCRTGNENIPIWPPEAIPDVEPKVPETPRIHESNGSICIPLKQNNQHQVGPMR